MPFCTNCGINLQAKDIFCGTCGIRRPIAPGQNAPSGVDRPPAISGPIVTVATRSSAHTVLDASIEHPKQSPHHAAAKSLTQLFGLDFRAAFLTIVVDILASGLTGISLGVFYFIEVTCGIVLGVITYKIQVSWYGDDSASAQIKALIIGLLTAIPAPITPIFAIPAGLLGAINIFRSPRSRDGRRAT